MSVKGFRRLLFVSSTLFVLIFVLRIYLYSLLHKSYLTSFKPVINGNLIDNVNVSVENDVEENLNKTDIQTETEKRKQYSMHETERKHYLTGKKLVIALYHFYSITIRSHRNNLKLSKCLHYKNCKSVYINSLTNGTIDADAVLIQGNRIPKIYPYHRDDGQVFVFVSLESPVNLRFTDVGNKRYHHYFNWTMTYRMDSDIQYLYGSVVSNDTSKYKLSKDLESGKNYERNLNATFGNGDSGFGNKNYSDIFRKKTGSSFWFVSHCKTSSERELYVRKMAKFTNITQVGRCNKNHSSVCPQKDLNCEFGFEKKYKFYIAFENSLCNDYITEKAFKWFSRDIVLVVRGSRNYKMVLPKGTFIDTNDFKSAKSLALYLNKLGSDEERYTNILKRKDHFKVIAEQEHAQIAYCNLCYKLNNLNQYRKSIKNVDEWWSNDACVKSKDIA